MVVGGWRIIGDADRWWVMGVGCLGLGVGWLVVGGGWWLVGSGW